MSDRTAALHMLLGATGLLAATSSLLAVTGPPRACPACAGGDAVGRRVEQRVDRLETVVREAVDDLSVQVQDVRDAVRRGSGE